MQLQPIGAASATEWDEDRANVEVRVDLNNFLNGCDLNQEYFLDGLDQYKTKRTKYLRTPSQLIIVFAKILDSKLGKNLQGKTRNRVYKKMVDMTDAVNATWISMESFVEGKSMRGWPLKVDETKDQETVIPEFEAYHGGHAMEAMARAAKQIALHGEHQKAASLVFSSASAIYDGFITDDLERTKLNDKGVVVYVPVGASDERVKRYKKIHPNWICLEQPQATNHGLSVAFAASALLKACKAIDWTVADWTLVDGDGTPIKQKFFLAKLEKFVKDSYDFLSTQFIRRETSNDDSYQGDNGTPYYIWRYRDYSQCPEKKDYRHNRLQDTAHLETEIMFVSEISDLGHELHGNRNYYGQTKKHIRYIIVSMLAKIVLDRSKFGASRFACGLNGRNNPTSVACKGRRSIRRIMNHIPNILTPAITAWEYDSKNDCDVLNLVNDVLPFYLDESKKVERFCRYPQESWALLEAKFYYYWYDTGRKSLGCL